MAKQQHDQGVIKRRIREKAARARKTPTPRNTNTNTEGN